MLGLCRDVNDDDSRHRDTAGRWISLKGCFLGGSLEAIILELFFLSQSKEVG